MATMRSFAATMGSGGAVDRRESGAHSEEELAERYLCMLSSSLLQFDPEARVRALHDDELWPHARFGIASDRRRARSRAPYPSLRRSIQPPWSLPSLPPVGMIYARLTDDILVPSVSPGMLRVLMTLLDSVRGEEAVAVAPSTITVDLYAAAVFLVAGSIIGSFGSEDMDTLLRPHAALRLQSVPYIVAASQWLWRSGAVGLALERLTRAPIQWLEHLREHS